MRLMFGTPAKIVGCLAILVRLFVFGELHRVVTNFGRGLKDEGTNSQQCRFLFAVLNVVFDLVSGAVVQNEVSFSMLVWFFAC